MIYPRETWQDPTKPITGPPPKGTPRTWVIHYPGGGSFAPQGDQVPPFLRGIQASYLSSRKYSIGYSFGVAQDGSKWEIRGDDFNNAANAGRKVSGNFNDVSRSIFVMVADQDPASPAAVAAINSIIATHPDWDVVVHGDVDYTACCGTGLIAQVRNGTIGAAPPEPGPPPAELIYAGIDWNGTNYNTEDWIIPASGGGLVLQPDLSVRTASIRNDVVIVGESNSYMRPQTNRAFTVPFEVTGQMFIHSRMDEVSLIPSGDSPHWEWRVNFLPAFVDEDNNIVTGLTLNNRWSASGQIDKKYGIPRKETYTARMNHDDQIGAWHRWRVVVPKVGTHEVYWDDILVYRGVEEDPPDGPASWWSQPIKVALRFDFYDVSLRFDPLPQQPVTPPEGAPDMFIFIVTNAPNANPAETWLLCDGTQLSHIVDGHAANAFIASGAPQVKSVGADQTDGLIKSCKTMNDCPPEWKGTGWETLWNSRK